MPKRKAEESEDKAIKRIRRLEKRLKRYKDKLRQPEDCKYLHNLNSPISSRVFRFCEFYHRSVFDTPISGF